MSMVSKHLLEFVVKHQNQWATNASPEIAQVALEKSCHSFLWQYLGSTVKSSSVLSFVLSFSTFHHQSPSDCIKRVGECLRGWSDDLSEQESGGKRCVLLLLFVTPNESFSCIIASKNSENFTRNKRLCMWKYQQLKQQNLDTSLGFHLWQGFFCSSQRDRWIVFLLRIFRYRLQVWFWQSQEDRRRSN